jgi:hypothetical protein
MGEHAAHLPFFALVDGEAVVEGLDSYLPDFRRAGFAVVEVKPVFQPAHFISFQSALNLYQVFLLVLVAGVGQAVGKVAVVGEQ